MFRKWMVVFAVLAISGISAAARAHARELARPAAIEQETARQFTEQEREEEKRQR